MSRHLEREIGKLKKQILGLSAMVEESLQKAVSSLDRRDAVLACDVIECDREVDSMEVDIEEECLKILALHQPVANDLRLIVTVLKMNDELERIGDLAVNMAQRSRDLSSLPRIELPFEFHRMADRAQWMLARAIDAVIGLDSDLARDVWGSDREVDGYHRDMYSNAKSRIHDNREEVESILHWMSVSRFLERIADHATNIAKDVIYLVEGEIVRHRGKEVRAQRKDADAQIAPQDETSEASSDGD